MKTVAIVILCVIAVLVVVEYANAQQGLCDSSGCSDDCYEQGLHGQCDSDDICRCYNCIFRACKRVCMRQGRVGQCDENHCMCL
ncbi:Tenascin-X [Orchesella cincta]|uniref:Tenascin-X n=1 Tax=Orchesella cincta TaxID=48709 RepID=A0A1D2MMX4_ORCCI|nr:Tenascin-X [Orchesella cincta]